MNRETQKGVLQDDFHEAEVEYALTEPRITGGTLKRDFISDKDWAEFEGVREHEIQAFIYRWENLPIEEYVRQVRDLQVDNLRVVVHGEIADVSYKQASKLSSQDPTLNAMHKHFPPVGPGSPLISNVEIRSIDPDTAVAVYHRSEYDLKGNAHESESALILVRQDGRWKAAAFTRRPLPATRSRRKT